MIRELFSSHHVNVQNVLGFSLCLKLNLRPGCFCARNCVFSKENENAECFVFQINPNSKAYNEGIQVGDYVESINGQRTQGLEHQDAQKLIKAATDQLILELTRCATISIFAFFSTSFEQ